MWVLSLFMTYGPIIYEVCILCINKCIISVINKSIINPDQGGTFLFYAQLIRKSDFHDDHDDVFKFYT